MAKLWSALRWLVAVVGLVLMAAFVAMPILDRTASDLARQRGEVREPRPLIDHALYGAPVLVVGWLLWCARPRRDSLRRPGSLPGAEPLA